jgi:hypothetical protein
MFDYIGIKVNDLSASKDFYTLLLDCCIESLPEKEGFAFYNHDSGSSQLVTKVAIRVFCISHLFTASK